MFRPLHCVIALIAGVVLAAATAAADVRTPRDPSGRVGPRVPAYPTHPRALDQVDDCDALRTWVTDATVETLVHHLYWWHWLETPWSGPGGEDSGGGSPSDFTTTNVQEEGVDELDVVKTDGNFLYIAQDDSLDIVRSWPAETSQLISSVHIGEYAHGLFVHQDRALVMSHFWGQDPHRPYWWYGTRLTLVDMTHRGAPVVERTIDVEGYLVGTRMIDGHVYAVTSSWIDVPPEVWELLRGDDLGLPQIDWDATDEEREAAAAAARQILRPLVAAIVAGMDLEQLIPLASDSAVDPPGAPARPLMDCSDLYVPAETSSYSVLSVVHLDLGAPDPASTSVDAIGLAADGWQVYASQRSLYVSQSSWWSWWRWNDPDLDTTIHRFALGGDRGQPVRYAATGVVPGWLHNQFSLSEYEGYLRVATTQRDWWWGRTDDDDLGSVVSVLSDDGHGELELVGQVDGIAPGEQIYSTRFLGPSGYMVTFEVIDPLFTLDLSDPTDPRVVGELEVTGYSSYLHPMDDDHLLAVGMEATEEGRMLGLAVSVFDVSDPADPVLDHRYLIEDETDTWSWSEALYDHHAFTFHRGVLSIPAYVRSGEQRFAGLVVMAVDADLGISELGQIDHQVLPPCGGSSWVMMRRSVYIEDFLFALSSRGLSVSSLDAPELLQRLVSLCQP